MTPPKMLSAVLAEDEAEGGYSEGAWRVGAELKGLTPGATYCVELVATNASGTGVSAQVDFTSGAPSASITLTGPLMPEGLTAVLLLGRVEPDGLKTEYDAAYGPIDSPWCLSSGSAGSPEDSTPPQPVTGPLAEADMRALTPGAEYCAEFVARNLSVASSAQIDFTAGAPWGGGSPQDIGATTAQVLGVVWGGDDTSEYHVEYGLASSTWCKNSGVSGSPEHSTPPTTPPPAESIVVSLAGLTPATAYCEKLVATDDWGSDPTLLESFTTLGLTTLGTSGELDFPVVSPSIATPVASQALSDLVIVPGSFVATDRGASIARTVVREHRTGATVRYRLDAAVGVTFTLRRVERGRAVKGGRCVTPTSENRHARACTLARELAGSFSIASKTGSNSFHFTGRFDGKTLSPGQYLLVASPATGGKPVAAYFRIVS
jgi:hypothetical protein